MSEAPNSSAAPKKKPFFLRWWFLTLVAVIIIGAIASGGKNERAADSRSESSRALDSLAGAPASAEPAASEAPSTPTVDESASKVTLANFKKVKTGMNGDQVWAILGPGELLSEAGEGEYHTAMYMWKADNGIANMNVTFQNGRVSGKAQLGLE